MSIYVKSRFFGHFQVVCTLNTKEKKKKKKKKKKNRARGMYSKL